MNGLPGHVILVGLEVWDFESPDGVDRNPDRLCGGPGCGGAPQPPLDIAQLAQDLSAVEPLPLTVFAEAHRP